MGQLAPIGSQKYPEPFNLTKWWKQILRARVSLVAEMSLNSWGFIRRTSTCYCSESNCPSCKQVDESRLLNVTSAVDNLVSVISDVEYQLGVQQLQAENYPKATSFFKLSTSHQNAAASFNLGICYEQGIGVRKNLHMAMECFYLSSNLGHPKAMYNLGVYYAKGLGGLHHSRSLAKMCFIAAAALGQEDAIAALEPSYPQIVLQLKNLSTPVIRFDLILGLAQALLKWICSPMVIVYVYVDQYDTYKNDKLQWRRVYRAKTLHWRKRQRIFQPKKGSGALKHKIKTRLLEGQCS